MISHSTLHYAILKYIIEKGYAPGVSQLSKILSEEENSVVQALYDLQEYHGVVLHPNEPKIWVIHPFSLAPTNFLVETKSGKWWGNCAWCSLGVAALLKEDLTITTTFGAHGEKIIIHIQDGEVEEKDLLVHFPIPMKKAWDNVIYTCSTMLVFKDLPQVEDWCMQHNIPKGDVQPISKIWEFSKKWYGNHLNPNWKKWTMEEAKELFEEFELNHEIWDLETSASRF